LASTKNGGWEPKSKKFKADWRRDFLKDRERIRPLEALAYKANSALEIDYSEDRKSPNNAMRHRKWI
jgi:hypothetical protein